MGTIILFNGNIFRWFNVSLGILYILVLPWSSLFAFLPGVFDGFNAVVVCIGAPLPVPGCWLAPFLSTTHVRLFYKVLQSCYWNAGVNIFKSMQKMASSNCISPCSIPRAPTVKMVWHECCLITRRHTALSQVFCCMSSTLFRSNVVDESMKGSRTVSAWEHAVSPD